MRQITVIQVVLVGTFVLVFSPIGSVYPALADKQSQSNKITQVPARQETASAEAAIPSVADPISAPLRGEEPRTELPKAVSVPVPKQGTLLSGSVGETIQTAFLLTFAASVIRSLNDKKKKEEED